MKQSSITIAYKKLIELYKKELPFPVANKLFLLKKKLQPYVELQIEKEKMILEASGKEKIEYTTDIRKAMLEILNAEVEWEEKPIVIIIKDDLDKKLGITGEVIDQLYGFVDFKEE